MKANRILILGDCHFPFAHTPSLRRVLKEAKRLKPDLVIQVGDLHDQYSFSRFPRNHDVTTPADELERAAGEAAAMWEDLQDAAPKARCVQLLGNHDIRITKRIEDAVPEVAALLQEPLEAMFSFDGVETIYDPREEFFVKTPHGTVCFMHGHRGKLGDHAAYNQMSTVCGHSHQGGVVFKRNRDGIFFELNAGWLGDEDAPVFQYTSQKTLRTWTRGFALIDEAGPRFVSLGGAK